MRKILTLLVFSVFILTSCGDDGPPGPPGEDGPTGKTYEYDVDFEYFAEENLHSAFLEFPETKISDGVLVYRMAIVQGNVETWSLIPQNFFLPQGIIQYVYTHTDVDVELIIDGNFDLRNLANQFTQNQVFRVIIVPSDFQGLGVDVKNMEDVMNALNLDRDDIIRM